MKQRLPNQIKRVVIKVGSNLLLHNNTLNLDFINDLSNQIKSLKDQGIETILVSSGAIAAGLNRLNKKSAKTLPENQACAAIGQTRLMHTYDKIFENLNIVTGQILIVREDFSHRTRYLNINNTLTALLKENVLPIINENDSVAVQEITFGDNDVLSAMVANMVKADLLIILSSIAGLKDYANNTIVSKVEKIDNNILSLVKPEKTKFGTGGMETKLEAAKIVMKAGEHMIIADGKIKNVLNKILNQEEIGTIFCPPIQKLKSKKRWIAFSSTSKGIVEVDKGASEALLNNGKSLLASGITKVEGKFEKGDIVSIVFNETIIAKGLTNYTITELEKIKGLQTDKISSVLGYKYYDTIIHRDNMVLI